MSDNKYLQKVALAKRVESPVPKDWTPEATGVPNGKLGLTGCCNPACGKLHRLALYTGEYLLTHLKCSCGHVFCRHCTSDTIKVYTAKELRAHPVKVPQFQYEAPYFSVCSQCGLTYRAKKVSNGFFQPDETTLEFKPWGSPCDFCENPVTSEWDRMALMTTEHGVVAAAEFAAAVTSKTSSGDTAQRTSSFLRSATGGLRAISRLLHRKSARETGEAVLDPRNVPGAAHQRRRMDRDHNIPYDWEVVEYDADTEVYTYRDGVGCLHQTHPGNKYGPYVQL